MRLTRAWLARHASHLLPLLDAPAEPKRPGTPPPKPSSPLRGAEPGETGPWEIELPGWRPPSLNRYVSQDWRVRRRLKMETTERVAEACVLRRIPRATRKRRVSIRLAVPSGRHPDHDNLTKALYDGLTACGALVDDGPEWVETGRYDALRGPLKTVVILEDVEG